MNYSQKNTNLYGDETKMSSDYFLLHACFHNFLFCVGEFTVCVYKHGRAENSTVKFQKPFLLSW